MLGFNGDFLPIITTVCYHMLVQITTTKKIFEYFFANLAFLLPWQPIKFSGLDKIHMVGRGLLKEQFCKTFVRISMATISCHSNQSSYPIGTKNTLIRSRGL